MKLSEFRKLRREAAEFKQRFSCSIHPSVTHTGRPYFPASIRTKDGKSIRMAILMKRTDAIKVFNMENAQSREIPVDAISIVSPSEDRIDYSITNKINRQFETSMSNMSFILKMKDGREIAYWGSSVLPGDIDFLKLPNGFSQDEIRKIHFIRPPPPKDLPFAIEPNDVDIALCFY